MKKKVIAGAVVCSAVCLLAPQVFAYDSDKKANYVVGQVGAYKPTSDLDNGDYDTGFNTSVAYGRYLTDNIVLEGMVDFFSTKAETTGQNETLGRYDQDNSINAVGFLATLKAEYPVGPVDLFGGAGLGFYGVGLTSEVNSSNLGKFQKQDEFDNTFGAHVSLGANYNITERFYVGLEGRYRWTGEVTIRETIANVPMEYDGNLNGYTIAGAFGFRF